MSTYSHIDFAANELAHVLVNNRSMRWREQSDIIESMIYFHELDIETCDYDWVGSKAEQLVFNLMPNVKRAGW